ncbi:hypothetical protein CRG98_013807 [Punica granatum]|uniref:Reverse transcriptase domain-containing protein n=1 Tax=Punica granatum TaxID=22663 RepID=A0A2I0KBB4_PUNGR|nr:hypothetical protein CRG98_013807 [Punica granatum]
MDSFSGYNQIRMAVKDKLKTMFTTIWGTFCYRVMPFGLKNAGTTYQWAMVTLFHDMMHKEVEVYVDDMIAKSKEGEDHLVNLKLLFDRLREYKLRLNPAKCTFGARSGNLLGFVVSERGIEVDPDKVKAIKELPPPSTVREVRGFRGRLNYIARFIANLTDKCQPLFRLLRKNAMMEWDHECQKAFDTIKAYLIRPPILRFRQYTLYHTICLLSKAGPLRYLLDSPSSMRNIAKWHYQLTEYDIEYVPRTSIKGQAIADHLAEFPIDDDTLINTDFPDEGILQVDEEKEEPTWKMFFDGAVNSVGSGVGVVLISPDRRHYPIAGKVDFSCTNNVAEYEACILDLQAAIDFKVKELKELAKNFEKISFTYTPRAKNQFVDALATLASMVSISEGNIIELLEIEVAKGPAHYNAIEASEAKPWYEDIRNFLRTGQYPPFADRRDRKTLRRLAMHYFLSGKILYCRSFDSTLLRCIDEHESRPLMEEVHRGNCGPHMNGLMLAKKIMRLGYYCHIQVYPGSSAFGSIPATFRSILSAFGSIPATFRSILVHLHSGPSRPHSGLSWPICIRVHPGHIQVYPGSFGSIPALNSSFRSILAPSGPSRSRFPAQYPDMSKQGTSSHGGGERYQSCRQAQKGGAYYGLWLHPLTEHATCAHPNLISSGHACGKPMQCSLGVSTFPGTRDGHA